MGFSHNFFTQVTLALPKPRGHCVGDGIVGESSSSMLRAQMVILCRMAMLTMLDRHAKLLEARCHAAMPRTMHAQPLVYVGMTLNDK